MAPLSLQQAVRIVLAASMLVIIISSAEELLTEPQSPITAAASAPLQYRHPSDESPRNTDTKTTAAASAPLHQSPGNPDTKSIVDASTETTSARLHPSESKYTYTMQYQIGKEKLSGLVDTGSDLIWTNNSELLDYESLESCPSDDDGKEMPPSHGAPCLFDKTYGHGAAHVSVLLGEAKLTWESRSAGAYTTHDLIKIGSPVSLKCICHVRTLNESTKYNMACRVFRGGGIVGLGRGKLSLVSQLRLKSFSYCLPHGSASESGQIIFNDDTTKADSMPTLDLERIHGLKYPASSRYYVGLKGIKVGTAGDVIDVPNGCFGNKPKVDDCSSSGDPSSGDDKPDHSSGDDKPDHAAPVTTSPTTALVTTSKPDQSSADKLHVDGNRGMVIDSGTSFTTLPQKVFDRVKKEVKQLLKKETDKEPKEIQTEEGFICYEGTRPERMGNIELHFCSQGKMLEIPADNYFFDHPDDNTKFCLAFKSGGRMSILGAYQQRGMYMLFKGNKGDEQGMKELSFAKRDKCT